MPPSPPEARSSRHSAGLLLHVDRPGGHADEFYLADGLTIGRTLANSIVLPDDESVDRIHARVEVGEDGRARLCCVEPDSSMTLGGEAVRDLLLDAGIRFRIGRTELQCLPGRPMHDEDFLAARPACPFCGPSEVSAEGQAARPCPGCHNSVLPVLLDADDSVPILVPVSYGDYRAGGCIGRDDAGLMLRGVREGGPEPVAIKVLLPGAAPDRRDDDRFEREMAMTGQVRHPRVIKLLDHGTSGGFRYLVVEWIEGRSLREVIADADRAGKLTDFADASRWFEQVATGLAAIHAVGMAHRDIRPSTLLIDADGDVRIAGLGIAGWGDIMHASSTAAGLAPGVYRQMTPAPAGEPDTDGGRSDYNALGVTFYEVLTGTRPVGEWRPTSVLNPSVPPWFDDILGRLLATDRGGSLHDDFELMTACVQGFKSVTPHVSDPCRPWPPWVTVWGFPWMARGEDGSPKFRPWRFVRFALAMAIVRSVPGMFEDATGVQVPSLSRWWATGEWFGPRPGLPRPIPGVGTASPWLQVPPARLADEDSRQSLAQAGAGNHALALALARRAVQFDPSSARAFYALGWAHHLGQDYDRAIDGYDEAIRLDPDRAAPYNGRGVAYGAKGDHDRALLDYDRALQLEPDSPLVLANRGISHQARGDLEPAIADFVSALRLEPPEREEYADLLRRAQDAANKRKR